MVQSIIRNQLDVQNSNDVIKELGGIFLESDLVKETYINAVLEREQTMPTGLNTGTINVAIPHTDSEHVNESALALATLKKPVKFRLMDDPTKEVDVEIVFLLAVKDPMEQLGLLRKLMSIFQDDKLIYKMKNAQDDHSLNEILNSVLA